MNPPFLARLADEDIQGIMYSIKFFLLVVIVLSVLGFIFIAAV